YVYSMRSHSPFRRAISAPVADRVWIRGGRTHSGVTVDERDTALGKNKAKSLFAAAVPTPKLCLNESSVGSVSIDRERNFQSAWRRLPVVSDCTQRKKSCRWSRFLICSLAGT